jgi:hypothetical protein
MRKLLGVVAVIGVSWAGSAMAAEALLIRHEVLTVPIGSELTLKPGFFIGKAWTADGYVADASMTDDMRTLMFKAKAPGRTVVTAYNLREPNKRVEFEIVVSDEASTPLTPSLVPTDNMETDDTPVYEPIEKREMESTPTTPAEEKSDDAEDMDPMN